MDMQMHEEDVEEKDEPASGDTQGWDEGAEGSSKLM
jgi:hypothetical protein